MSKKEMRYEDAGVNIDAGNEAVQLMKGAVQASYTEGVLGDLGGFGGLFSLGAFKTMKEPVLVSGTDGVGTKLQLAIALDKHDTIGQDCVAMCINDVLVQGAKPLFFLDYVAVGKLDPVQVATIVGGVARACKTCGAALLGGETAEMPGSYKEGDYDLAGFAVGIVDKEKLITGESIKAGDLLLGLPSSGVHSNGFSLVRHIISESGHSYDDRYPEFSGSLGEELLTPTRLYPPVVQPLMDKHEIKGMVHITGGGFYDNIPRILPKGLGVHVDCQAWPKPDIFSYLEEWGHVPAPEMYRTFNMGIGFILVLSPEVAEAVQADLKAAGETSYIIGKVVDKEGVDLAGCLP